MNKLNPFYLIGLIIGAIFGAFIAGLGSGADYVIQRIDPNH